MKWLTLILKFAKSLSTNGEALDVPLRILVVDDNPTDLLLIQNAVTRLCHHQCEVVDNLTVAEEILKRESYDGVLLDVHFADTADNGVAFFRRVAKTHPELLVIFVTGNLSKADIPNLPYGLVIVITKPTDSTDFTMSIVRAVNLFAMDRAYKIALNAKLTNISGTVMVALVLAFLAGRFWPQVAGLVEHFAK